MNQEVYDYDIVLVWAWIMSATLLSLLHELDPTLKIALIERLDSIAQESSAVMNNAGTWHSAFCELNYTPEQSDGTIDISKAVAIAESFELSKQFWTTLTERWYLSVSDPCIHRIPHCSVVFWEKDSKFLKTRYDALQSCHLFHGMEYSEDHNMIQQRMPLVMKHRTLTEKIAATYMDIGTDIDFWKLTRQIVDHMVSTNKVNVYLGYDVFQISQSPDTTWTVNMYNKAEKIKKTITTKFIFVWAGGGALPLLQKADIVKKKWLWWFPVSGQWLVCTNPSLIAQHDAKVYGKAALWAPPMSVPHLDTRMIDGQKALLFGPYAGFTPKFLKKWSFWDLPFSIRWYNILAMMWAGIHNLPLTKYLIDQVLQSSEDRLAALREYVVDARQEDWVLQEAWYRVQIIKADKKDGGVLQFGTEVIVSEDKTFATLLWASPWASTAVSIMLEIVEKCFPHYTDALPTLIFSYGKRLSDDAVLTQQVRARTYKILGI